MRFRSLVRVTSVDLDTDVPPVVSPNDAVVIDVEGAAPAARVESRRKPTATLALPAAAMAPSVHVTDVGPAVQPVPEANVAPLGMVSVTVDDVLGTAPAFVTVGVTVQTLPATAVAAALTATVCSHREPNLSASHVHSPVAQVPLPLHLGEPAQAPPPQVSNTVQSSESLQLTVLLVNVHPVAGTHASVVHVLLSLHAEFVAQRASKAPISQAVEGRSVPVWSSAMAVVVVSRHDPRLMTGLPRFGAIV